MSGAEMGDDKKPETSEPMPPGRALRPRKANGLVAASDIAVSGDRLGQNGEARDGNSGPASPSSSAQESGSRNEGDDPDPSVVPDDFPTREVSESSIAKQQKELRHKWDFSVVIDFLEVFGEQLKFGDSVIINTLERDLLTCHGGEPSVLRDVHQALLRGIYPSRVVTNDNWIARLAACSHNYFHFDEEDDPFLGVERREAAAAYVTMSAQTRAMLLRALCELRCEQEDVRSIIDLAQKSEKRQIQILEAAPGKRKREDSVDVYSAEDFNQPPWGEDREERQYWLHDLGFIGGYRLCRETLLEEPPTPKAGKKAKRGAQSEQDLENESWETVACTLEEIEEIATKLSKSQHKRDVALGKSLQSGLIDIHHEAVEEEERKREHAERQRLKLEQLMELGKGRSMRQRKQVDYNYDIQDEIEEAIRESLKQSTVDSNRQARGAVAQEPATSLRTDGPICSDAAQGQEKRVKGGDIALPAQDVAGEHAGPDSQPPPLARTGGHMQAIPLDMRQGGATASARPELGQAHEFSAPPDRAREGSLGQGLGGAVFNQHANLRPYEDNGATIGRAWEFAGGPSAAVPPFVDAPEQLGNPATACTGVGYDCSSSFRASPFPPSTGLQRGFDPCMPGAQAPQAPQHARELGAEAQ